MFRRASVRQYIAFDIFDVSVAVVEWLFVAVSAAGGTGAPHARCGDSVVHGGMEAGGSFVPSVTRGRSALSAAAAAVEGSGRFFAASSSVVVIFSRFPPRGGPGPPVAKAGELLTNFLHVVGREFALGRARDVDARVGMSKVGDHAVFRGDVAR